MRPLINGRNYDWSQIVARFSNSDIPLIGIKKIAYGDNQEIENTYGAGNMVTGRGFGNYAADCTVSLTMEEVEKIQAAVPSGRVQDITEFDLVVSYVHPTTAKVVVHKICNCVIPNNRREPEQNAKEIVVDLNLLPSHIDWNNSGIIGLGN